jgi:signal transduction histidine kinase
MEIQHVVASVRTALTRVLAGRDGRVAVTFALAGTAALEASLYADDAGPFPQSAGDDVALTIVLNVLAVLPLLATARFPLVAAAGSTLLITMLLAAPEAPLTISSFAVFLYSLGHLVVRRGLLYAGLLLAPLLVNAVVPLDGKSPSLASLWPLVLGAAALLLADSTRRRTEVVAELGATQEAMARRVEEQTVMEERARIARELHDIVAHHLSVITVQSETGRLTTRRLPPEARARFEAIGATARDALSETRRLLGVLREDAGGGADRTPAPGLDRLPELLDTARDTGTNVRLVSQGKATELPASSDLAAYRVIQEALTNVRRHAPGADVDVEVSYDERVVHLRVRDHGPGPPEGELVAGHGLVGMRDRAAIAGGTFSCGAAPGGGFVVEVTLPSVDEGAAS